MHPQSGADCSAMNISKFLDSYVIGIHFRQNKKLLSTVIALSTEVLITKIMCRDDLYDVI